MTKDGKPLPAVTNGGSRFRLRPDPFPPFRRRHKEQLSGTISVAGKCEGFVGGREGNSQQPQTIYQWSRVSLRNTVRCAWMDSFNTLRSSDSTDDFCGHVLYTIVCSSRGLGWALGMFWDYCALYDLCYLEGSTRAGSRSSRRREWPEPQGAHFWVLSLSSQRTIMGNRCGNTDEIHILRMAESPTNGSSSITGGTNRLNLGTLCRSLCRLDIMRERYNGPCDNMFLPSRSFAHRPSHIARQHSRHIVSSMSELLNAPQTPPNQFCISGATSQRPNIKIESSGKIDPVVTRKTGSSPRLMKIYTSTTIVFLLLILFPTLSYTKSVYRPLDDSPTITTDAFPDPSVSPSIYLKLQQPGDGFTYEDTVSSSQERVRQTIESPARVSALKVVGSSLRIVWSGIVIVGHLLSTALRTLQTVALFFFNKLVFLLQPFIIMGTGIYTFAVIWPIRLVDYLAKTFYPIYLFLACASIVGLVVGSIASYTSSYLNNSLFPRPPPKPILPAIESRPKTAETPPESVFSSGTVTPAPYRVPPPSKYPSGGLDDIHILDTNALFSSFSLPAPPPTPPGILYTAPTPAGSVSGVVGETIFEEDDDSDDKTPVASVESWAFGAGKPLTRPESAHGRMMSRQDGYGAGTWHPKVKREDVDVQGIDFGDDGIRKRK